jgi:hypothetical protein
MTDLHRLRITTTAGGFLFECAEGCGRRLVVDRAGVLSVIDRGDAFALHRGGTADLELAVPGVTQP